MAYATLGVPDHPAPGRSRRGALFRRLAVAPGRDVRVHRSNLWVMPFLIDRTRTAKPSLSPMVPTDGFAPLLSERGIAINKPIESRTDPPKTRAGIYSAS